jgi:hypothetical protein
MHASGRIVDAETRQQMASLTEEQKQKIDAKIRQAGLNDYGDPKGTMYAGGTPLFNEMTGQRIDRYVYILRRHPDWAAEIGA